MIKQRLRQAAKKRVAARYSICDDERVTDFLKQESEASFIRGGEWIYKEIIDKTRAFLKKRCPDDWKSLVEEYTHEIRK